MTGWAEAQKWLSENADDWRLLSGEAELQAGVTMGAPTYVKISVLLANRFDNELSARGEGATYLEAVQHAVGGLLER